MLYVAVLTLVVAVMGVFLGYTLTTTWNVSSSCTLFHDSIQQNIEKLKNGKLHFAFCSLPSTPALILSPLSPHFTNNGLPLLSSFNPFFFPSSLFLSFSFSFPFIFPFVYANFVLCKLITRKNNSPSEFSNL